MGEDRDDTIERRLSTLEVQIRDVTEIKTKIDGLYTLITEFKLDNVRSTNEYATKKEFADYQKHMESRLDEVDAEKKKLLWATITAGLTFGLWLIEQLLHVKINFGG